MLFPSGGRASDAIDPEEVRQLKKQLLKLKRKNGRTIERTVEARWQLVRPEPRLLYCLPEGWKASTLPAPSLFYKARAPRLPTSTQVVAVVGTRMLSVFDGMTEYELGRRLSARRGVGLPLGWPPLECCFYAYTTPEQAVNTEFPRNSALLHAPKLLIQVRAAGRAYRNEAQGVWAFTHLMPTLLLSDVTEGSSFVISTRFISPPRHAGERR
eukprot:jgi/Tetstr1/423094/TSEL_013864.t1